jgi:hypothetical protein
VKGLRDTFLSEEVGNKPMIKGLYYLLHFPETTGLMEFWNCLLKAHMNAILFFIIILLLY